MGFIDQELLLIQKKDLASGPVELPGSKSLANRALLLASLAKGKTLIKNIPSSDDVAVLLRTLPSLGVEVSGNGSEATIHGVGGIYPVSTANLNLENAGTALRPLVSILAASSGSFTIDGNEQMRKRPIGDLVAALQKLGVRIESNDGFPPVTIEADGLEGGEVSLSGAVSSQFISSLLLAAPLARNEITLTLADSPVSKPYIDMTVHCMLEFGVDVKREEYRKFHVPVKSYRSPGVYTIEPDATAASYFLAAGALPGCGPVRIKDLSFASIQGDLCFLDILKKMGAEIGYADNMIVIMGPSPSKQPKLHAVDVDMNNMPDVAMTLAVLALFCDGESHIRNIANLRVKESERIRGLKTELEKLGAKVREEHDALHITPPEKFQNARIETYDDHRMAMAFSLAAFGADVEIMNPACVTKTFPNFFETFLPLLKKKL